MDINESTYVMCSVIFRCIPRESRESPAKDGTARQTRRTKKDSFGRKHEGTSTLRDRWLMNRVLRCFIRSVRRSRFSKLQPLRALAFAGADQHRSVHPGAILVKLNAPNQLLARPHNRPWWRVMKHCVPVTITGICVCKRAGNYLRRVARPDGPILLPVTRLPGRYDHGETQFTYSVKAIVIMLLATARGTTLRRIGTFQRGE